MSKQPVKGRPVKLSRMQMFDALHRGTGDDLTSTEHRVLATMLSHANRSLVTNLSLNTLVWETGSSLSVVKQTRARLVGKGWLKVVKRGGGRGLSAAYQIDAGMLLGAYGRYQVAEEDRRWNRLMGEPVRDDETGQDSGRFEDQKPAGNSEKPAGNQAETGRNSGQEASIEAAKKHPSIAMDGSSDNNDMPDQDSDPTDGQPSSVGADQVEDGSDEEADDRAEQIDAEVRRWLGQQKRLRRDVSTWLEGEVRSIMTEDFTPDATVDDRRSGLEAWQGRKNSWRHTDWLRSEIAAAARRRVRDAADRAWRRRMDNCTQPASVDELLALLREGVDLDGGDEREVRDLFAEYQDRGVKPPANLALARVVRRRRFEGGTT